MELCSIKSSANNEREISKGLGKSLKNDCVCVLFIYFFFLSLSLFVVALLCFKSVLGLSSEVCSANAFQKPFFKAQ